LATPRPPALPRSGLPLNTAPDEAALAAKAGTRFEALLIERLLKGARAAQLGDDLMGDNGQVRDLVDEQRAAMLAEAAPLGLARLLSREAKR
jgi:Rod binding domain-containing protein